MPGMAGSSRTLARRRQGPSKARSIDPNESAATPTPGEYIVRLPPRMTVKRELVDAKAIAENEKVVEQTPVLRTSSPPSKIRLLEADAKKPTASKDQGRSTDKRQISSTPTNSQALPGPFLAFGRPAHLTKAKIDEDCRNFQKNRCRYGETCDRVHPITKDASSQPNSTLPVGPESDVKGGVSQATALPLATKDSEDTNVKNIEVYYETPPFVTATSPPNSKQFNDMSQAGSDHPSEGTITESPASSFSTFESHPTTRTSTDSTSPFSMVESRPSTPMQPTPMQMHEKFPVSRMRPYCRNWILNRCTLGAKCYFYHGDMRYVPPIKGVHPRPRFSAICPKWEAGRCMLNWLCDFVHGDLKYDDLDWIDPRHGRPQAASLPPGSIGELTRLNPSERENKPPRPPNAPIICRKWLINGCRFVWACHYVHEDIEYEPPVTETKFPLPPSKEMCQDPQCARGYGCYFTHKDLDYTDCLSTDKLSQKSESVVEEVGPSVPTYKDPPPGQRPRPPSQNPCLLHSLGKCHQRYRCKYVHEDLEYDASDCLPMSQRSQKVESAAEEVGPSISIPIYNDPLPGQRPRPPSQNPCLLHSLGQCRQRYRCKYVHEDLEYDAPAPDLSKPQEDPPIGRRPLPAIAETCVKWLRDECPLRYECQFRHGDLDYDPLFPPGLKPPPHLIQKMATQNSSRPPWTLRIRDHAKVKIGSGFDVQEITTGFETPWVYISNIPQDVSADDVAKFVGKYGEVLDVKFSFANRISTTKVRFSTSAEALEACTQLNGIKAFGSTIATKLPVSSALKTRANFQDTSVRIRWAAPSRTAYCGYNTMEHAEKAMDLARTPFRNNCVQGYIHSGIPVVGMVTVRFQGIPLDVKDADMQRFNHPEDIVWTQPNYKDFSGAVSGIRRALTGEVEPLDFKVLPPPYRHGGTAQAWAHFSTPSEAEAACKKLDGWKPMFTGKTRIRAQHVKSLTFTLSPLVYTTIQNDIGALQRTVDKSRRTAMSVHQRSPQFPFIVKLAGDDLRELGQLKAELESILNWETLKLGNRDAYDPYFAHDSGYTYLDALRRKYPEVRIRNDATRRTLQLRGSSYPRRRVKAQILSKIAELKSRKVRSIPLDGPLLGIFLCNFLDELCKEVGRDNVVMELATRSLCVRGDNSVFSVALEAVRRARQSLKGSEQRRYVTQCPVCLDEVSQPVLLPCGHSWCQACLVRYLVAAIDTRSFPLACLGKEGKCGELIPLVVARAHLAQSDFDALVDTAFENYVHCHPEDFRYCPTPDCSQIYRPGAPETVLQCPSCLLRICPNCHIEAHDGFDCPEKDGGHNLFKEWMKNHDVKPCPGCNVPIERSEGCNHMTCTVCKTHICWVCMQTFPGGKGIYDHMRTNHGGIGLPDPLQEYMGMF